MEQETCRRRALRFSGTEAMGTAPLLATLGLKVAGSGGMIRNKVLVTSKKGWGPTPCYDRAISPMPSRVLLDQAAPTTDAGSTRAECGVGVRGRGGPVSIGSGVMVRGRSRKRHVMLATGGKWPGAMGPGKKGKSTPRGPH